MLCVIKNPEEIADKGEDCFLIIFDHGFSGWGFLALEVRITNDGFSIEDVFRECLDRVVGTFESRSK